MKIAYWNTAGGTPLKAHLIEGDHTTLCGAHRGDQNFTWFPGRLNAVECHNCLRVQRGRRRKEIRLIERRLAGKDYVQSDAFM